jgi:hypothetical protein
MQKRERESKRDQRRIKKAERAAAKRDKPPELAGPENAIQSPESIVPPETP